MSKAMIRSVSLLALAGMLWASAAHAQVSESDMLMRIDQLQACHWTIRHPDRHGAVQFDYR